MTGLREDEYLLRRAGAVSGPELQAPNPNLQKSSVFIVEKGPSLPRPPWLYLARPVRSLLPSLSLSPLSTSPLRLHSVWSGSSSSSDVFPMWLPGTHKHTHTQAQSLQLSTAVCAQSSCCPAEVLLLWVISWEMREREGCWGRTWNTVLNVLQFVMLSNTEIMGKWSLDLKSIKIAAIVHYF